MSCQCCCTHEHSEKKEKRNNLLKDYGSLLLSALLLFGGIAFQAKENTFITMFLIFKRIILALISN